MSPRLTRSTTLNEPSAIRTRVPTSQQIRGISEPCQPSTLFSCSRCAKLIVAPPGKVQ